MDPDPDPQICAAWHEYKAVGSTAALDTLMTHYRRPTMRKALRIWARTGKRARPDDLIGAALSGLLDAARHYDPLAGTPFFGYASRRIHGAIVDWLRDTDHVKRSARAAHKATSAALAGITQALGRAARPADLARYWRCSEREAEQWIADHDAPVIASSDAESLSDEGEPWSYRDYFVAREPDELVSDCIRDLLQICNTAERIIILLYYVDDWTMRDIGDSLGLSESRISQMHSDLVRRFRARLEKV